MAIDLAADREFDVVVLGGGGSGLAAAIEAAVAGASVLVVEKGDILLGSAGRSVGAFAASRTPDQKRLGIRDSPELHREDYRKLSGELADNENEDLAQLLVTQAAETLAWLRDLGMEFYGPVEGPGHSVPRVHSALPGSRSYIHHLSKRARRLGVKFLLGTSVESVQEVDGKVGAVTVRTANGKSASIRACRAVVISTGDFSASAEMKREHIGDRVARFLPVNPHACGDGQRMGQGMGGQILNGHVYDPPTMRLAPPPAEGWFGLLQRIPPVRALTSPIKFGLEHFPGWLIRPLMLSFVTTLLSPREELFRDGALLVDHRGEWCPRRGEGAAFAVAELGEEGGYIIGDHRLFEMYSKGDNFVAMAPGVARAYLPDFRRSRRDTYAEADSLRALAEKIHMAPDALESAVARAEAADERQGVPIFASGPYFALGPVRSHLIQTGGGLKVTSRMEVVGLQGQPIAGLYAAGNAGQSGLALFGYGHHLAWAFISGRIAGRNAANFRQGA